MWRRVKKEGRICFPGWRYLGRVISYAWLPRDLICQRLAINKVPSQRYSIKRYKGSALSFTMKGGQEKKEKEGKTPTSGAKKISARIGTVFYLSSMEDAQ